MMSIGNDDSPLGYVSDDGLRALRDHCWVMLNEGYGPEVTGLVMTGVWVTPDGKGEVVKRQGQWDASHSDHPGRNAHCTHLQDAAEWVLHHVHAESEA